MPGFNRTDHHSARNFPGSKSQSDRAASVKDFERRGLTETQASDVVFTWNSTRSSCGWIRLTLEVRDHGFAAVHQNGLHNADWSRIDKVGSRALAKGGIDAAWTACADEEWVGPRPNSGGRTLLMRRTPVTRALPRTCLAFRASGRAQARTSGPAPSARRCKEG